MVSPAREVPQQSADTVLPVRHARIAKCEDTTDKREAVRIYKASGTDWNLQVRGPQGIGGFGLRKGKAFMIATASLSLQDLCDLRDAINAHIAEVADQMNAMVEVDVAAGNARPRTHARGER